MRVENANLSLVSVEMVLYLMDQKELRQKYADDVEIMCEGLLKGLLIDIGNVFNVPLETIQSGDYSRLTVLVRSIYYHIARAKTHYGIVLISKMAGRKDHSDCVHHTRKVIGYLKVGDPEFLSAWNHYLTSSKLFTKKDFT
jgi:chromosomal replication initiation ATPase DnaA